MFTIMELTSKTKLLEHIKNSQDQKVYMVMW